MPLVYIKSYNNTYRNNPFCEVLVVFARKEQEKGVSGDWEKQGSREKCPKLFLQHTFSRLNFCRGIITPKICCTRTFDPSIAVQDLFGQFSILPSPLNICQPHICSGPVCFVSLLYKTRTNLHLLGFTKFAMSLYHYIFYKLGSHVQFMELVF